MSSTILRDKIRQVLKEDGNTTDEKKAEMAVNLLREANTLTRQLSKLIFEFNSDISDRLTVATELINELKGA